MAARRRRSMEPAGGPLRRAPDSAQIARRRRLLRWTKRALPAAALLLLASIAAWPEIDRSINAARLGLRQAADVRIDAGRMLDARYRGLDGHDQPYTITADEAGQASAGKAGVGQTGVGQTGVGQTGGHRAGAGGDDRINLQRPVADTLGAGGSWLRTGAAEGVYMQHAQLLDLQRDVTLYRDDGIMVTSPVADMDLRRGIVASDDWIHAEGPFGVLDAQGYLLSQNDGLAQFRGPGRLVLNDDRIARPASPRGAAR